MLKPGLYEQVINQEIGKELDAIPQARQQTADIDQGEASSILAQYITEIVRNGLDHVVDEGGDLQGQIALINDIVNVIKNATNDPAYASMSVDDRAQQLLNLISESKFQEMRLTKKEIKDLQRPQTSIIQSSLFTGAEHEPQMFSELKKEIASADRIDMLVSFIKWSGLVLLIDELREFTEKGGQLRIITTSYMGATDLKAVDELNKLQNTEVKVSYDTKRTRLHAKTYVFYRDTGFTTAYVGSSNISNAALSSGLEWNVKATSHDMPDVLQKITATFETYWHDRDFETYNHGQYGRLKDALLAEKNYGGGNDVSQIAYFFDIRPYPYQQEILDSLQAEREVRGYYRNLVCAATGTGKTIISALDYRSFCKARDNQKNRLLFVAHRKEILEQSLLTFRGVLKDPNFGDLFVGNHSPASLDHLFVSIQTLNSRKLYEELPDDYYDYIIVDEFHHAAATTYQRMLSYFKPKILLGLTATPERMDGKDVLDYFDGRIAAEIRLPEAVDRKLLCPFHYFGITDTVDLKDITWSKGGYDKQELEKVYYLDLENAKKRVNQIVQSLDRYITDINTVKGLGFCVSIGHAQFMSDQFNAFGIPSICLTGGSSEEERETAKKRLVSGEIKFIFVVDIYNEGVDIPEVNTVLFLRPTESLTIFLQQLGRGLRLAENKDCLTVLDFIGQANKKYNFEEKFAALLSHTKHSVKYELENGFINVPKGCYIQLERIVSQYVLDNIKDAVGMKSGLIRKIKSFEEDTGRKLSFAAFIKYYHLDVRTIYNGKFSFARLCQQAGVREDFTEKIEQTITKALGRLVAIDSRRWIQFLLNILTKLDDTDFEALPDLDKRMLQMFYMTIWQKYANWDDEEVLDNLHLLSDSPVMLEELIEFLKFKYDSIDFIDEPVDLGFDCPLDLYCTYTRDQILVALDFEKPATVREGVKWLPDKKIDAFFITLNKSDKDYSPTTMYEDYSINEELFHWQSQSTTAEDSATGQRYIHHVEQGSKVLLFVREKKKDIGGNTAPYTYLGLSEYVSHKGSRPMSIIWKIKRPIPAKYLRKTNQLVV